DPKQPPEPRYPRQHPSPYGQSGGYGQGMGGGERGQSPYGNEGWYGDTQQGGGYNQPPAYPPGRAQYPGGSTPQWPDQAYTPQPEGPAYGPPAGQGVYREQRPAYAPAPPVERPRAREERHHRSIVGRALPHLPIAHVFLIGGLAAMAYAISQQWGVTALGAPVFVKDFAGVQLNHGTGVDTSGLAIRAATGIVVAGAALSAGMILFNTVVTVLNKVIGVIGLSGCATLLFFPVLWGMATLLFVGVLAAGGFAGLGFLNNLPVVQSHGITTVQLAQRSLGFYLWAGGAVVVFVGMLGELVMRRR